MLEPNKNFTLSKTKNSTGSAIFHTKVGQSGLEHFLIKSLRASLAIFGRGDLIRLGQDKFEINETNDTRYSTCLIMKIRQRFVLCHKAISID